MRYRARAQFWRHSRRVKFVLDSLAWVAAIFIAYFLRLETHPESWAMDAFALALVASPTFWFFIHAFGLHRQSWGHVGMRDLASLAAATACTGIVLFGLGWLLHELVIGWQFPRSVPLIATLVAFLLTGWLRLTVRGLREGTVLTRATGPRTLIVGVEGSGLVLARELDRSNDVQLIGFLDENPLHTGLSYLGHPVLGHIKDLRSVVAAQRIDQIILALDAKNPQYAEVRAAAQASGARFRATPSVEEMLFGLLRPDSQSMLPDLLQRPAIQLDTQAIQAMLRDKVVLVTGAGGSIGSEIVRQVAAQAPQRIILVAHEENSLFELDQELTSSGIRVPRELAIATVRDHDRLDALFQRHKPHVVFHAAAHKHVPIMEANPSEAVLNNILGTQNLANCVLKHGVERFVNISTDKAVRPTNVMGASKRVAEMVTTDAATRATPEQHLVSVRFGNVLGSRGSVIPTWMKQIAQGGPVTVTDERMTRYFMLIPEAVQLVLQAAALGGQGRVYVLDMGQPIKMVDVARQLIRMHGLVPDEDIAITFTGMRPGEKLYEELIVDPTHQQPSSHPKIFIENDAPQPKNLAGILTRLQDDVRSHNDVGVKNTLLESTGAVRETPTHSIRP